MNTNRVFIWLKEFEYSWLPRSILNDTHLIELITTKLHELEQLLTKNDEDENETVIENENEIIIENELPCAKSNDTEQIALLTEQRSSPTPPDTHNQNNHENEKTEKFSRPAIRLKRIPLDEAAEFLPPGWKITNQNSKSKRRRKGSKKKSSIINPNRKKYKKNSPTNKPLPSSNLNEILNNSNGIRKSARTKKPTQRSPPISLTNNDNKKKTKRKLRAIDAEDDDLCILGNLSQTEYTNGNNDCDQISRYMGQNGILSQTRKTNETTVTTHEEDFPIKLQSRQSNHDKTRPPELITIDDDVSQIDDDEEILKNIIENNDNDSLFTSLDITNDKTLETTFNNSGLNYNDCIEDITNDGIDPPPSTSSPNLDYISLTT